VAAPVLFAGGGTEGAKEVKPILLKYAHVGVPGEIQTKYAEALAASVKEKTNGRLTLQVYPSSQLGGVSEMVDGVKGGGIDMAHHDFSSLGKYLTDVSVFNSPFIYRDAQHALHAGDPNNSPVAMELNEKLIAAAGIRMIGQHYRGARQLSATYPVYSPADMKGKKFRGVPVQLWMTMLQGMGAIPTPVEIAELHTALLTGVVLGQENPLENIYAQKFYEVQKYIMMTSHMHAVLVTFINEKSWQKIPEADRKLFQQALEETRDASVKWVADINDEVKRKLVEKGMTFIDESNGLKLEEFRTAVRAKLYQDFPTWKGYVERIQAIK
jgi:tripartite ATP-independent transporter DctP family solute receptor